VSSTAPVEIPQEPATVEPELPAPEPIQRRLLRPHTLISFGIAALIVALLVRRLDIDPWAVWQNLRNANPALFLAALAIYYLTFVARTFRWRYMLVQAGIPRQPGFRMPSFRRLFEILMLSWFANCVVPAKLGDGYRCYLLKQDSGASFSRTLGTILAERLTDLVVLFVTMSGAGLIAFQGNLPSKVVQTMLAGIGLIAVGVTAVAIVGIGRNRVQRFIPERFHRQFEHFHTAIFACLRRPGIPTAISLGVWAMDGLRFYLVAAALGAGLSFPLAVFVALMSALLTTLPITPAGVGVVELAVVVVLKLVDIHADMASSIALMDRLIGYWSLIVVGLVLYLWKLRREVAATPVPVAG
jgi:uncharacterized protein (TIRG00374 family)